MNQLGINPQLIIGIDPSLTSTGVATIGTSNTLDARSITSKPTGDTPIERLRRIHAIRHGVTLRSMPQFRTSPILVVIEAPAYASRTGRQHDRSGLWWHLVDWITTGYNATILEVAPATRAKYATGKGNASKGAVIDATARRFPLLDTAGNDNVCDAIWLAAIGADLDGRPIADMPQAHRAALDKIALPVGYGSAPDDFPQDDS